MNRRPANIMLACGQLSLPAYLVYRFANTDCTSLFELLLSAVALLSVCTMIYFIGRWDWFGIWLRYLVLLVPVTTILLKTSESQRPLWTPNDPPWIELSVDSVVLMVSAVLATKAFLGRIHEEKQQLDVAFPFVNGNYCVTQGGGNILINYHFWDESQKFALDIVKLGPFGTRALGMYPSRLDRYSIWQEAVRSPVNGTVIAVVDGLSDEQSADADDDPPAGNYVLLKPDARPDCYLILAHLRKASVKVRPGEVVRQGRVIGAVGTSGDTSEPHLHIHCVVSPMDAEESRLSADRSPLGRSIPIVFGGKFLVRNSVVSVKRAQPVEADQLATSTA